MEAAIRPGPAMFPFFMPQYAAHAAAAAMPGINPQRFRIPLQQPPFHFNPAVSLFPALNVNPSIMSHQPLPHPQQAPPHHPPHPNLTRMPTPKPQQHQPQQHQQQNQHQQQQQPTTLTSVASPMPNFTLTFTQEEVDMVLYGYTKGRTSDRYHGHALSGLKFGDLSHGIDRILSDQHSPNGSASEGTGSTCSGRDSVSGVSTIKRSPSSNNINNNNNNNNHTISPAFNAHHQQHQHHLQQQQQQHNFREHLKSSTPTNGTQGHTTPSSVLSDIKWNLNTNSNNNSNANNANANNDSLHNLKIKQTMINNATGQAMNKLHIDPAALDLQDGLAIFQTHFAGTIHTGVFCTKTVIARGTRYGPFKGRVINTSEVKTLDDNTCMWEIFQEGKLSHFIDGHSGSGNWMAYINCARYAQEQNLIAIQVDGEIWYETCKDIPQGTELLVWYGDCYLQFMGVPVALKEMADGGAQDEADSSEGFTCDRCGKVFAYKYYRDKHLKYTRCVDQGDRKYPCHLCTRSFEKRDRLRIHILHVHEKHRPHKCLVCGKSFSQSSSLNKHMRVHSGERPYKCVYCNKAFTASSILRTHIRQHSGEKPFKCKHCGKAFASHAAHDSHVRRTHAKEKMSTCNICGKGFQQAYQLKFHMGSHMGH